MTNRDETLARTMLERASRGELSRRELLRQVGGVGGVALFGGTLASFLASCGGAAGTPAGAAGASASGSATAAVRRGGSLSWAYTLVRHSSNTIDKGMAQDARWPLGAAPDPGLRAGI